MKKLSCILLIDDDIPTNFYNRRIIEIHGCADHVEICTSGKDGFAFVESKLNGEMPLQPQLIFLDINMPGVDGWEFLDAYSQLPFKNKEDVVIVMLTTSANPDDEKKALKNGVKTYVTKPLTPAVLDKLIEEYF